MVFSPFRRQTPSQNVILGGRRVPLQAVQFRTEFTRQPEDDNLARRQRNRFFRVRVTAAAGFFGVRLKLAETAYQQLAVLFHGVFHELKEFFNNSLDVISIFSRLLINDINERRLCEGFSVHGCSAIAF